jgi:class 3 adenylate cyclase/Tol biopolymer transport system component
VAGAAAGPATFRGFLFADLRGYTGYVDRHGDRAAAALLAAYRTLVRDAVGAHGGAEIKTEGDSFYVVFPSASAAVTCGLDIASRAAAHTAAHPEQPIAVGIGVHAGESVTTGEGYVGAAVNTAARVCAQAAAGEVLVTETVRALVRSAMPVRFDSRGRRPLKGLAESVVLYRAMPGEGEVRRRRSRRPAILLAAAIALVGAVAILFAVQRGLLALPIAARDVIAFTAQIARTDAIAEGCLPAPPFSSVWLTTLDGAPPVALGADLRRADFDPTWSPDGHVVAYAGFTPPDFERHTLRVSDSDGSDERVVATVEGRVVRFPSWSPDGRHVAFVATTGGESTDSVEVVSRDGTGMRSVMQTRPGIAEFIFAAPQWIAADRLAVVVDDTEGGTQASVVVGLDGAVVSTRDITAARTAELTYSPDGAAVAYVSPADDGSSTLSVAAADLSGSRVLVADGRPSGPAWSPDGREIAFAMHADGKPEIHVVEVASGAIRRITTTSAPFQANCQPTWGSVAGPLPSHERSAAPETAPLVSGIVEPGRHPSNRFQPPFEVTLDEGWWVGLDKADAVGIDHLEEPYGQFGVGRMQVVYTSPCATAAPPTRLVGAGSADVAAALESLPHLEVSDPLPVTSGVVSGLRVDVTLKPDALEDCPAPESPVGLVFPVGDDALTMVPGSKVRVLSFDVRGEAVVFMLDPQGTDFDAFANHATPILESLAFPAP